MNTNTLDDTKFEAWMREVDKACESRFGISIHDLPDFCFRDSFDDGYTPAQTARAAIRNASDY